MHWRVGHVTALAGITDFTRGGGCAPPRPPLFLTLNTHAVEFETPSLPGFCVLLFFIITNTTTSTTTLTSRIMANTRITRSTTATATATCIAIATQLRVVWPMFIYFLMSVKGGLKGLKRVYKRKALKVILLG